MIPTLKLEIRDLDGVTKEQEIQAAVAKAISVYNGVNLFPVTIYKTKGTTSQIAVVDLLEADALRLAKKGKSRSAGHRAECASVRTQGTASNVWAMGIVSMSVKDQTETKRALNVAKMAIKGQSVARRSPSASFARPKLPQLPGDSGCGEKQVSSEMIQVLQGNMNRARGADELLEQIAREEDSNILLLSEQSYNINHEHWLSDDTGSCTIWL